MSETNAAGMVRCKSEAEWMLIQGLIQGDSDAWIAQSRAENSPQLCRGGTV
jgi:hypothetical protein